MLKDIVSTLKSIEGLLADILLELKLRKAEQPQRQEDMSELENGEWIRSGIESAVASGDEWIRQGLENIMAFQAGQKRGDAK